MNEDRRVPDEALVSAAREDPPLRGRRVSLRPVRPNDVPILYELALSPEVGPRWRTRGKTPGPEEFARLLWNSVVVQFVAVDSRDQIVGLLSAYRWDEEAGHVHVAMMVPPSKVRAGWTFEGAVLFVNYVFWVLNVRKIYIEIPAFNQLRSLGRIQRFLQEEARLREHLYLGGCFWDMYLYALYRSEWEALASDVVGRVVGAR